MKLRVLENIYGQYVYIFSVLSCTVDGKGKTSSSGPRKTYSEGENSYNEYNKLNYAANPRVPSGESHCARAVHWKTGFIFFTEHLLQTLK